MTTAISRHIIRNTYVDNVFYGANSVSDGVTFYKESKSLFHKAGMNLCAYANNSTKLNHYFEREEKGVIPKVQKLLGLEWDTTNDLVIALSSEKEAQWEKILSPWTIKGISIPHLIVEHRKGTHYEYDLHVFADASSVAYCAAAYLVQGIEDNPVRTSLTSKCRLASLNHSMTIPCLEIAALMIGSKLLVYFSWTDSVVALYWTKNNKSLPIFVKNRVSIILDNTSDVPILHLPSEINPVDMGTRACPVGELIKQESWWNGPAISPSQTRRNLKLSTGTRRKKTSEEPTNPLLHLNRFSPWTRLLATMMFVFKFLTKKSKQAAERFGNTKISLIQKMPWTDPTRQLTPGNYYTNFSSVGKSHHHPLHNTRSSNT
ncbi:unnamed protein product [Strongylus vulgaris]|uniref:Uncharacterized protein n=1 Tax=Strongylus vulgaris TaxID=40348 RepID=A0A3P7JFN9_STRVU|nr:unnamed protein product [Strongylus vulgaris]